MSVKAALVENGSVVALKRCSNIKVRAKILLRQIDSASQTAG